jgi:hypothetical protein
MDNPILQKKNKKKKEKNICPQLDNRNKFLLSDCGGYF